MTEPTKSTESTQQVSQFDKDPVTPKEVFGYNMGAVPGAFFMGFMGQIQAFYYRWMGLEPFLIFVAQVIYALWNMFNDPIFGLLMNRTKTKQGRYIPWIKWCAPLFTAAFIVVFLPPGNWRRAIDPTYQIPLFFWYLITQIVFDTFYTIVYIAHVALLPQMTMQSTERTKISVIYGLLSLIGGLGSGLLPVAFLTNPNDDLIFWFQVFVVIFGLAALVPWYFVVRWVHERQEYLPDENIPLKTAFSFVFKNPSGRIYVIYDGVSVGILNLLLSGITFMLAYLLGLNDEAKAPGYENWGIMDGIVPLVFLAIGAVAGVIIQLQIPKKYDIKTAIQVGLIAQAIGFTVAFFGALPAQGAPEDLYRPPSNIYLLGIGLAIAFFGVVTDFIYHNPMRGDTIDFDEATTGERHEAIYAGIGCIFSKPMISVALITLTSVMGLFGLLPANPDDPSDATLVARAGYPNAILGVAIATLLVPGILAAIGAVAWHWYPLDRKALVELHKTLDVIHEKKRAERLGADGRSKFLK